MIRRVKAWLRRGRDEADLEAILAHNAQVKRERAELIAARAKRAVDAISPDHGANDADLMGDSGADNSGS